MVKKHNLVKDILVKNIEQHINHLNVGIKYYEDNKVLSMQFEKERDFYIECLQCIKKYSVLTDVNKNTALKKCIYYRENMNRNKTYIRRYKLMRAIVSYNNKISKEIEQITF